MKSKPSGVFLSDHSTVSLPCLVLLVMAAVGELVLVIICSSLKATQTLVCFKGDSERTMSSKSSAYCPENLEGSVRTLYPGFSHNCVHRSHC